MTWVDGSADRCVSLAQCVSNVHRREAGTLGEHLTVIRPDGPDPGVTAMERVHCTENTPAQTRAK